jgi:hypothetical protein
MKLLGVTAFMSLQFDKRKAARTRRMPETAIITRYQFIIDD